MSIKTKKNIRENDVVTILEQYQEEHQTVSSLRTMYAVNALRPFFTGRKVSHIDIPTCRHYTAHREGKGISLGTIARELTTLRAACNHAKRWKRLHYDCEPVFEIPRNLPKREVWLLKDELRTLINTAEPHIQNFINICYGTGSRRGAIENLQWNQINFNRRTINLNKIGEVETKKRRPTVPMGTLYDLLCSLYDIRENDWVLGSNKDLLYEFTKTCKKANLLHVEDIDGRPAGKITPHILRHSRATHLLEDGVSIYNVAKLLGDTPMTVQRVYGHVCMSNLENDLLRV